MAPPRTEPQATTPHPQNTSDAAAILAFAAARAGSEIVRIAGPDGKEVEVAKRADGSVVSLKALVDEHRLRPESNRGTTELYDQASFVAHAAIFQSKTSVIYVDEEGDCTVVYDHATRERPEAQAHRATFSPGLHASFVAWSSVSEKWLSQTDFAELIQARFDDIREPDRNVLSPTISSPGGSASIRTLADGLEVSVGRRVANHSRLQSGESRVVFEESHTDGGGKPLTVPDGFLLGLPVFASQKDAFPISVRLRYRVKGAELHWQVKLLDLDDVRDVALAEHCERLQKATGLTVLRGAI